MLFVGLTVVAYQAILLFTQYSLREIPIIASSMVYRVSCLVISDTVQQFKDVLDYDLSVVYTINNFNIR